MLFFTLIYCLNSLSLLFFGDSHFTSLTYLPKAMDGAPNSLSDEPLSDIVASEIAAQLHLIKNNEVLIIFLRGCVVLKGSWLVYG